ncbi:MAG: hypothetical protein H0X65_15875 [Gemmatimonadetes bacterium]|nr:hypothetical protein [Gemmatimonadota bacterium]
MTQQPDSPKPADPPARPTPYELAFGETGFDEQVFPAVAEEAEGQKLDPARRERFAFLSRSGDAIREVIPRDAPPESLEQYRALLFHAFNFWRAGKRVYRLDAAVARYLVEAAPRLEGWEFAVPYPAVYLQLPPNLFWASIAPDMPPEPVDGFFVTTARIEDAPGGPVLRVEALMVLGLRRDRAGFSVIPLDTEAGAGIPIEWADLPVREDGGDFANVLPGGEIAGLYSILTAAEALKLLGRALWYIDQHAGLVRADVAGSAGATRLPFFRVMLGTEAPDAGPS